MINAIRLKTVWEVDPSPKQEAAYRKLTELIEHVYPGESHAVTWGQRVYVKILTEVDDECIVTNLYTITRQGEVEETNVDFFPEVGNPDYIPFHR